MTSEIAKWRPRAAVLVGLGALLLFTALFALAPDVILATFAAVLWAVFLGALSQLACKWTRIPYGWCLFLVVSILVLGCLGLGWFAGPRMVNQFEKLGEQLPSAIDTARQWLKDQGLGEVVGSSGPDWKAVLSGKGGWIGGVGGALGGLFATVTYALIIFVLGLYFAATPALYVRSLIRLVPPNRRDRAREIVCLIGQALRWWLVGRVSSMAVVGVLTLVGLLLLNVPLAVPLAILAALLSFIPNIGPVLSAVPAILIGFSISPMKALWVVILYLAVQTVESYAITPLIQRKAVSLPPGFILVIQILFSVLFGAFGLLVATPMAVAFTVIVQCLYIRDVLADDLPVLGE